MISRRKLLHAGCTIAAVTLEPHFLEQARAWFHGSNVGPLRFAAANNAFPSQSALPVSVASATTTRAMLRDVFHIGSGDFSQLVFSFMACSLVPSSGWVASAGGYSIVAAAFEYNGTSTPILFSGGRTKTINSGDTDIKSDALLPASFSLSSFTRGSTGFVRLMLEFSSPATMKIPGSSYRGSETQVLYDVTKVNVTNGVDSTGGITYAMINGGTNGVDAVFINTYLMPIVLGRFVAGDPPVWLLAGDSKTIGNGDPVSAMKNRGMTRALYPDPTLAANCIAGCNFGCASGIAAEWAAGTPAFATPYLAYANYGLEAYGTNAQNAAASQAIHATFRANNFKKIVRLSLTPRTTSTDAWATDVNQTTVAGWSPGGAADLFEQAMAALVASDLTYIETSAIRGTTHWLWPVTGAANYSTADGLHESAVGYELRIGGTGVVTTNISPSAGSIRSYIASLP